MVVEAWESIPEDMIAKSFVNCGQTQTSRPEEITCMKAGRTAEAAMDELKKFWDLSHEEFEENLVQEIAVDEEEDIFILDDSEPDENDD